ncbi:MAG: hypothetical protein ABIO55_08510 [Ginsengibacter sp.]
MFLKKKTIKNHDTIIEELLEKLTPDIQEKIDYKMNLAAKIFAGIKSKGWNKSEFANQMNKNNSIVSRWLSGLHNFESDTLFDIQNKLGINLLDDRNENEGRFYTAPTTANYFVPIEDCLDFFGGLIDLKSLEKSASVQVITTTVGENNN